MKKGTIYKLLFLTLLALSGSINGQQGEPKRVGKILTIEGKAYVKDSKEAKDLTILTSKNNGRPLFAKQEIGCISKCKITFTLGGGTPLVRSTRYIVPNEIKLISGNKNYIVTGGNKSGADILLFPIESSTGLVRLNSFGLRWRLLKVDREKILIKPLTVSLNSCEGAENIWSTPNIDYRTGSYFSEKAVRDLKKWQLNNENQKVEIVVESKSFDKKQRFCFSLISPAEEEKLQKELVAWNDYADFFRLSERAQIFRNYRLYQDAVSEYEEALKLFPGSGYLLDEALGVYLRIGDADMALKLVERLRKIYPGTRRYIRVQRDLQHASSQRLAK